MGARQTIVPRKRGATQYSLANADGVVIHEPRGAPVDYVHGVSDIVHVKLFAADAFGERDLARVIEIPRDRNHPLAGQILVFEVEIQGIRDATPRNSTRPAPAAPDSPSSSNQTLPCSIRAQGVIAPP